MDASKIMLLVYYYEPYKNPVASYIVSRHSGVYVPFDKYLYKPLQKCFRNVICYDYLKRAAEIGHKAMNQEILEIVRWEHPDYVLWISYYYDVYPETLDRIRKMGSKVIGYFFDDEWRFDEYSKYWAEHLDYAATNYQPAMPKYEKLGCEVAHTLPNTGVLCEFPDVSKKYDVSFVGSREYANREQVFEDIRRAGLEVTTFGYGWPGGCVSFDEMLKIFRSSKINLNFSVGNPGGGNVYQIKGRVFQVCMAGGFMLTEYTPLLDRYYTEKEIVTFTDFKDMKDKINYYLTHDTERETIARAGWERSQDYSSELFMRKLFEDIRSRDYTLNVACPENPKQQLLKAEYLAKEKRKISLKMPVKYRGIISGYYFEWALAFKGNRKRQFEELIYALRNHPQAVPPEWLGAYIISCIPAKLQNPIRKFYRSIKRFFKTYNFFLIMLHIIKKPTILFRKEERE